MPQFTPTIRPPPAWQPPQVVGRRESALRIEAQRQTRAGPDSADPQWPGHPVTEPEYCPVLIGARALRVLS